MPAAFPTKDYPVYITRRKIKKGETLTVHYGLPYWLLIMGVHPAEIGDWIDIIENN
jgi:hypothetical protein